MLYDSVGDVKTRVSPQEFLQFEERDPCYTWLFPLALGPFEPEITWRQSKLPRPSETLTLYVHIPFCRFICQMCPFTHEPLGRKDLSAYVNALCQEIGFYARHPHSQGRPVTTLYFGGGTASSLTVSQVEQILAAVRTGFSLVPGCEITLECHPRTVDRDYLAAVRDLGINRVSFGIQSFAQRFIDSLKLHQQVEQSRAILEAALHVGFKTVAMDLMYRYADQKPHDLERELDIALGIGVQGVSAYALDTELRGIATVAARQASIAEEREMYFYIHDRLHAEGFVHVAQPDYARSGHENLQLYNLWGAPQSENLSFGAGAFSESFNGTTWCNVHSSEAYVQIIEQGHAPVLMGQAHSWDDAAARYPALGVRCLKVPLAPFRQTFGVDFLELFRFELASLAQRGLVSLDDDWMTVTRTGKFYIDNVSKAFYNLSNRGKSQLWGVDLESLLPQHTKRCSDLLAVSDGQDWQYEPQHSTPGESIGFLNASRQLVPLS